MRFEVACTLTYEVAAANTPFLFNVEAQRTSHQRVLDEALVLSPRTRPETFLMPESGNRYFRITAGPGPLELRYRAVVELAPAIHDPAAVREVDGGRLPLPVLFHLYPSRYIESDLLEQFARKEFGRLPRGYNRVVAVCNWVHDHLDYIAGSSNEQTSARDTLLQRQGVCRDFAHLAIAFCRALGIPARFVSAYAWRLSPPDFHAVMEAWLEGPEGGAWFVFDPTRKAAADGMVRIGIGRDAAEVAFCTPFGAVEYGVPEVSIVAPGQAGDEPLTTGAVTLADV
ncbi:transglutaminase-like domain-containing protein [Teichococcus vastitatis]|uniref:Transglutaminase family protein n=1 Tax=Teichococcus vastitatis TaxID=2307076 RepID=A0ABS9W3D9_9PROT|nr:transglutaminase family protein [Pseudoroseomonas vastitatis]MCI0753718.1 transglutaminase family protein [Pseudoroseomonas vastitatis]